MKKMFAATAIAAIAFAACPQYASANDTVKIKIIGEPQKVAGLAGLTYDNKPALAIICIDGYKYLVLAGPRTSMEQSMAITQMFEEKKIGNTVASVPARCNAN